MVTKIYLDSFFRIKPTNFLFCTLLNYNSLKHAVRLQPLIVPTKTETYFVMKIFSLTLLVLIGILISPIAQAQSILIYDYFDTDPEPTDLSGTLVYAIPDGAVKRFSIKNMSDSVFNFRIERVKIEEIDGVFDFLACGTTEGTSTAYSYVDVSPDDPFITPDTFQLQLDVDAYLGSHYLPEESVGCSQYRYYVLNDSSDRVDSIDVRYCSSSGIDENYLEVSVYPNPTHNSVILASNNPINGTLLIHDLSGRELINENIMNSEKYELDVLSLDQGVYMLTLFDPNGNNTIFSSKLTVR